MSNWSQATTGREEVVAERADGKQRAHHFQDVRYYLTLKLSCPSILRQPRKPFLFTPAMGKSVLSQPHGGTVPLKGCWQGTAGRAVYCILPFYRSILPACCRFLPLLHIYMKSLFSKNSPGRHGVKGSSLGGLGLPCWKNTVAGLLDVL